jgi:4-hydroxybenzoate polyprenyltransferase
MTTVAADARPHQLAVFFDLIKFAHSVFALPFALIATFWAIRTTGISPVSADGLGRLGLILACMVLARTWAMTFNRLIDRRFDAANPRTAKRPSVTGAVSLNFMRGTLAVCVILFFAATAGFWLLYHNPWPLILAIPVLGWLAAYSLTKRFTALCHFWLGISLGLAPVSAWIAIAGTPADARGLTILLLGVGVMFWVAGFDILYALQDENIDRSEKLHSIPAAVGRGKAIVISRLCHLLTAAAFLAVGLTGHFHALFWIGYAAAVLLLVIEQSLVSARDISRINLAFMTANGLIGIVFGAMAIADTMLFR